MSKSSGGAGRTGRIAAYGRIGGGGAYAGSASRALAKEKKLRSAFAKTPTPENEEAWDRARTNAHRAVMNARRNGAIAGTKNAIEKRFNEMNREGVKIDKAILKKRGIGNG